jgi:hypothetical protein
MIHSWAVRAALKVSSRRACASLLSCLLLSSCGSEVGDLFSDSAIVTEPPATEPPATDPMASELSATGETRPPSSPEATASDPSERVSEASPAPAGRDDGAPTNGGNASAPPLTAGDDAPADAVPAPAAPVEPEPVPPVTDSEGSSIARVCTGVQSPLLLDFDAVGNDPTQALFGDFTAELSGGTFVYPEAGLLGSVASRGLVSDVVDGDWHISGSVVEQSGFGLFFDCQSFDASRFVGLAFRIAGNVGSADTVTLLVGTAGNDVSSAWRVANGGTSAPSLGRCTPARSEYDGTCNEARIDVSVTANAREVVVPFSALNDGSPERGVNPSELTSISWALPAPSLDAFANVEPYAVDLRLDDIRFIEAAPR